MGAAPIAPLTEQNTPPTEIFHALQQVEGEIAAINQAEQKTQEFSSVIERLKAQIRQRYFLVIGATTILLFIMLCWILQVLN